MGCVNGRTSRRAKNDTTWPATQVCRRPLEAGLGGHNDGVFGDDEGVENGSIPLRKRGRVGRFVCVIFSDFWSDENDYVGEKRNRNRKMASQMLSHKPLFLSCFIIERRL